MSNNKTSFTSVVDEALETYYTQRRYTVEDSNNDGKKALLDAVRSLALELIGQNEPEGTIYTGNYVQKRAKNELRQQQRATLERLLGSEEV